MSHCPSVVGRGETTSQILRPVLGLSLLKDIEFFTERQEWAVQGGGGIPIHEEMTGCDPQCSGLADKVGIGQNLDLMILEVFSNIVDAVENTRLIYFLVEFYVMLLLSTQISFYVRWVFFLLPSFFFFLISGAAAETIFIRSNILCQGEWAH